MLSDVTAVVVFCRTKELIDISIGSFRKFYPDMKLIIVDNSSDEEEFIQEDKNAYGKYVDRGDGSCTRALKDLFANDKNTELYLMPNNLGHGLGLDFGIRQVKTTFAYTFESDTIMESGGLIESLLELSSPDMYCIGRTEKTYYDDGRPVKALDKRIMRMFWAYALLVSVKTYLKYPIWDSNKGTNTIPTFRSQQAIADSGEEENLIIDFDVDRYVKHLFGLTRKEIGNPIVDHYGIYEKHTYHNAKRIAKWHGMKR